MTEIGSRQLRFCFVVHRHSKMLASEREESCKHRMTSKCWLKFYTRMINCKDLLCEIISFIKNDNYGFSANHIRNTRKVFNDFFSRFFRRSLLNKIKQIGDLIS